MSADAVEIRREVVAELVELAAEHAAGHEQLYEAAVEHGREEMAQRLLELERLGRGRPAAAVRAEPERRRLPSLRLDSMPKGAAMSRADDIALWHEVNRSIIGLTGVVEIFAKRVRRADRLELAREMIAHSDELAARAGRQTDEVAVARLEGQVQGWREAAARLRTRRPERSGRETGPDNEALTGSPSKEARRY